MATIEAYFNSTDGACSGVAHADEATHLSMEGGKYAIQLVDNDHFLRAYAQSVDLQEDNAMVERRTTVHKMFFDMDFLQRGEVTQHELGEYLRIMASTMALFFRGAVHPDTFKAYVFSSPHKTVTGTDDRTPCTKSGFHVIYPNLRVLTVQALNMRNACVAAVVRELGQRAPPSNTVEDVIDECVYVGNGLRMVYASKWGMCPTCKRLKKKRCTSCGGHRVREGRPYKPFGVFHASGEHDDDEQQAVLGDTYYCVRRASIRCVPSECVTAGYAIPEGMPHFQLPNVAGRKKQGKRRVGVVPLPPQLGRSFARVPVDDVRVTKMQDLFASGVLGDRYKDLVVSELLIDKNESFYLCHVMGRNSTLCANNGKCHSSSTVYFHVEKESKLIFQRCFQRKDRVGTTGVRCREFKSVGTPIDSLLYSALFGARTAAAQYEEDLLNIQKRRIMPMPSEMSKEMRLREMKAKIFLFVETAQSRPMKRRKKVDLDDNRPHPLVPSMTIAKVKGLSCKELYRLDLQKKTELDSHKSAIRSRN